MEFGSASLRQTSQGWEFSSELALENFVWGQLEPMLQLKPLNRQYAAMGEICDILALAPDNQLVILELKNAEDRYIIQQLTRYYVNLLEERPFADAIDYQKPVRLIAIAPTFHRHNHIDRNFSRLSFEFVQLRVFREDQFYFELAFEDLARPPVRMPIPYQEVELVGQPETVANLPKNLLTWFGTCSAAEQHALLAARQQILSFHPRMQELVSPKAIQYGTGKTKLCAEFCFDRSRQQPVLFLWLPVPNMRPTDRVGRLRLWLSDGVPTYIGHVPEGLGKMRLEEEWAALPKSKWPRQSLIQSWSSSSMTPVEIEAYKKLSLESYEGSEFLIGLVRIALQKWLDKL